MPRSVAEIQAEIAKVKQEIATRDMYRQPRTQVGWASYVGNGDRGLLDAYQNREDQYNRMMKQQQFQAAERALQLKHQHDERLAQQAFQAAENERNRQNAYDIAIMNKGAASEDKRDEAKLRLEKLTIAKSEAERVGGDTRQLDAEIKYLIDKYGFNKVESKEYNPRESSDYILAKFSAVDKDSKPEEIEEAINDISKLSTPEAAKRLAELDKLKTKKDNAIAQTKKVKNWKPGDPVPSGYRIKFENGKAVGLEKE